MSDMDTPEIRNGAVQYVKCPMCSAAPGQTCVLLGAPWDGRALRGFAHVGRRMEYYEWRDIYGPATKSWEMFLLKPNEHRIDIDLPPCGLPRPHCDKCSQCECGALLADHRGMREKLAKDGLQARAATPLKSSSDVDDLLG